MCPVSRYLGITTHGLALMTSHFQQFLLNHFIENNKLSHKFVVSITIFYFERPVLRYSDDDMNSHF
jgi:hypothetical protein